jgi:glutamate-1-semialdehyde 2,1-aminomutase
VTRKTQRSAELLESACQLIPGGVNSPVRAFRAVGSDPPFVARGRGARIWDADGNEYVDFVGSWGPLLFGHAPDFVLEAIRGAAADGTSFGAPTAREIRMAELVTQLVPSMEMVRFVSSGSEATSSAIRLARGVTGRSKIVKCAGCYHGSVDSLLVTAGSGVATLGIPETAGVPSSVAAETIVVEYNSIDELDAAFSAHGGEIAGFIVEPIAGNMGLVPPAASYLEHARRVTSRAGALLIFDEVISGFRVARGGAQEMYGVTPDLTCLGKIIGGGLPVGACGGRRDVMQQLAPLGPVYQAGTLSGNPLAMAAGIAVLERIANSGDNLYAELDANTSRLAAHARAALTEHGIAAQVH